MRGQLNEPEDTETCVNIDSCVPTITVNVDDALKERMDRHPEINWSEVTRQAIREKITKLELMDELTADSTLTAEDAEELATRIDEHARERLDELAK